MTDTSLALPWRSPFNRTGVWVSDGVTIAHKRHPLFGRVHALTHLDGWHTLGPDGATWSSAVTEEFASQINRHMTLLTWQPVTMINRAGITRVNPNEAFDPRPSVWRMTSDGGGTVWVDGNLIMGSIAVSGIAWHINTGIRAVMGADEHGQIVVHAGLDVES